MSDLRKQWGIVQKRVPPPAHWRKHRNALTSWKVGYAEVVAALPRPLSVWKSRFTDPWIMPWTWDCRLCLAYGSHSGHAVALNDALRHLHRAHGCPNRHTTGEPCNDTCVHCRGWLWCAAPTTERSDW